MSLDFYIVRKASDVTGPGWWDDPELFDANITHNLVPMWKAAGVCDALYESEGKAAGELVDVLRRGLRAMEDDPGSFAQYNAPNGWGTVRHAIPFLRKVLAACEEYPDGIVHVSR